MPIFHGYQPPNASTQPDTVVAVGPTHDLDADYLRLKEAGVPFWGPPQRIEERGMRCNLEDNLFELNDASGM